MKDIQTIRHELESKFTPKLMQVVNSEIKESKRAIWLRNEREGIEETDNQAEVNRAELAILREWQSMELIDLQDIDPNYGEPVPMSQRLRPKPRPNLRVVRKTEPEQKPKPIEEPPSIEPEVAFEAEHVEPEPTEPEVETEQAQTEANPKPQNCDPLNGTCDKCRHLPECIDYLSLYSQVPLFLIDEYLMKLSRSALRIFLFINASAMFKKDSNHYGRCYLKHDQITEATRVPQNHINDYLKELVAMHLISYTTQTFKDDNGNFTRSNMYTVTWRKILGGLKDAASKVKRNAKSSD